MPPALHAHATLLHYATNMRVHAATCCLRLHPQIIYQVSLVNTRLGCRPTLMTIRAIWAMAPSMSRGLDVTLERATTRTMSRWRLHAAPTTRPCPHA